MAKNKRLGKLTDVLSNKQNLAIKNESPKTATRRDGYISRIVPKSISRASSDIATWKSSLRAADNIDTPRRARLVNLYEDIMIDAHLTSQYELRQKTVLAAPAVVKVNGEIDEEQTKMVNSAVWASEINKAINDIVFYGHSLVELSTTDYPQNPLQVTLFPRQNIVPEKGILLLRESDNDGVRYRGLREFGTWILEFGREHDYGLLNKAVPHVLFMRFAQSCWSELCEIYGIPPRFMKTDTQDPAMLDRAETMMRDMGSAAWFIIDRTEEFDFAKGADTNGDVYKNLIGLCKEAISMLINGAVMGQDTENGNRSKEESSIKLFERLVDFDRKTREDYWNTVVIPALVRIGILRPGSEYECQKEENLEKLWAMVKDLLQYKDVPSEWIEEKFGIPSTDKPTQLGVATGAKLAADFFDVAP